MPPEPTLRPTVLRTRVRDRVPGGWPAHVGAALRPTRSWVSAAHAARSWAGGSRAAPWQVHHITSTSPALPPPAEEPHPCALNYRLCDHFPLRPREHIRFCSSPAGSSRCKPSVQTHTEQPVFLGSGRNQLTSFGGKLKERSNYPAGRVNLFPRGRVHAGLLSSWASLSNPTETHACTEPQVGPRT